jgi:hypothetical protein
LDSVVFYCKICTVYFLPVLVRQSVDTKLKVYDYFRIYSTTDSELFLYKI